MVSSLTKAIRFKIKGWARSVLSPHAYPLYSSHRIDFYIDKSIVSICILCRIQQNYSLTFELNF